MPFNSIEIILELDYRKREKAANWTQLATLKDAEHEMKNFIESLHGWFEARLQCLQWDLLIARLISDGGTSQTIIDKNEIMQKSQIDDAARWNWMSRGQKGNSL